MPRISREVDNITIGGRLEQFRPIDPETGESITDIVWAEKIGIRPQLLGTLLKNKADARASTIQSIILWMLKHYGPYEVVWWQIGGPKPKPQKKDNDHEHKQPRAHDDLKADQLSTSDLLDLHLGEWKRNATLMAFLVTFVTRDALGWLAS